MRSFRAAVRRDPSIAEKPQILVTAGRSACIEALELCLGHGADLNASWRGYRPLHALIQEKPHADAIDAAAEQLRCLDWMLEHGADPEQLGAWPPSRAVLVAAFTGLAEVVDRLLTAGARRDAFVDCALADTARLARELRRNPGLPGLRDAGGLTALQCCSGSRLGRGNRKLQRRLVQVATLLLDAGANPGARTRSWSDKVEATYFAISAGNTDILELLLARGANPTTALASAAWQSDDRFCEVCLHYGADLNGATDGSRPLLNEMIRWGQFRRAMWLLERGADPDLPDERGWTAVHQAASRGNRRMFRALEEAGGDLSRKDRDGCRPVDVAKREVRAHRAG
jgi:ankyrin repeat protein